MILTQVLLLSVLFLVLWKCDALLGIGSGYPCFFMSLVFIGACTAVIGDVAGHLGCFINLKDSVNAIAFVALGTSVPGRLSSRVSKPRGPAIGTSALTFVYLFQRTRTYERSLRTARAQAKV